MTPDCFVELIIFFGIYSYVKPYDVQVSKLTSKARYFKFLQDIFGYNLSETCYNNRGEYCPNVLPDIILNLTPYSKTHRTRRISRQLHNTSHSLAPPRFISVRIGSSRPMPLKGRLDIITPFSHIYYNEPENRQPIYNHNNRNNNDIRKSLVNNLLIPKNINFNYRVTTPTYFTMRNTFTHSLNDLIMSTAHQISVIDRQKYNSVNAKVNQENEDYLVDTFFKSLEQFERLFYQTTFNKLLSISSADRQENGISFIQSALFLYLALLAISTEVDQSTKLEIENCLGHKTTNMNKLKFLRHIISWLPNTNNNMKFRWASRLVLNSELPVSQQFVNSGAATGLIVRRLNGTETPDTLTDILNSMVEGDSGGALRNTFEEDDIFEGVCSVFFTTMYIRALWRSAPTVLNGTRPFYDTKESPQRSVRMIRINDIMQYVALEEWNADAIEIKYATPGLTLLLLIPRGYSIKNLATIMMMRNTSIQDVSKNMRTMRIAATLPIYTLRMTLLLPGKLEAMGISRLVKTNNFSRCDDIRLSHAVQRLMFWAEAGHNAFKDDGIEWDEAPELEFIVNRPYLFYLRWKNITLMNGNFVL